MGSARARNLTIVVAAVVVVGALTAVLVLRDGSDEEVSTDATPTTDRSADAPDVQSTGTTPIRPTAADDLARFFEVADRLDQQIATAASMINARATASGFDIDQATADAVASAWMGISDLEATIPAGLEPDLLEAVLVVTNDLVSRAAALRPASKTVGAINRGDIEPCLRNGAGSAARYPDDLATLRERAEAAPATSPVPPDSRQAEELAVHLASIVLGNTGCDSCGGHVVTGLPAVTIYDEPTFDPLANSRADGTIRISADVETSFEAEFDPATGWNIVIHAC
jgi:hypothetical protein